MKENEIGDSCVTMADKTNAGQFLLLYPSLSSLFGGLLAALFGGLLAMLSVDQIMCHRMAG